MEKADKEVLEEKIQNSRRDQAIIALVILGLFILVAAGFISDKVFGDTLPWICLILAADTIGHDLVDKDMIRDFTDKFGGGPNV